MSSKAKKAKSRRTDGISFRKFDNSWYSSVSGKYAPLLDEYEHKIKGIQNEQKAKKAFHLAALNVSKVEQAGVTVGRVCDSYLTTCREKSSESYATKTKMYLVSFLRFVGDSRPADSIERHEIKHWLKSCETWGPTTKNVAVNAVVAAYNYGREDGLIKDNQLAKVPRPSPQHRIAVITPEQEKAILELSDEYFTDYFNFLMLTGCRPNEATAIEAKNIKVTSRGTVVELANHKTVKKTGKPRRIICNPAATAILTRLVALYPEGKLFRNRFGQELAKNYKYARDYFQHLRTKIQKAKGKELSPKATAKIQQEKGKEFMPDAICLYSCRHSFATKYVAADVPIAKVAALIGNSIEVCSRIYTHVESQDDVLFAAVNAG